MASPAWTETALNGPALVDEAGAEWTIAAGAVVLRDGAPVRDWRAQLLACDWPVLYALGPNGTWYRCSPDTGAAVALTADPRPKPGPAVDPGPTPSPAPAPTPAPSPGPSPAPSPGPNVEAIEKTLDLVSSTLGYIDAALRPPHEIYREAYAHLLVNPAAFEKADALARKAVEDYARFNAEHPLPAPTPAPAP